MKDIYKEVQKHRQKKHRRFGNSYNAGSFAFHSFLHVGFFQVPTNLFDVDVTLLRQVKSVCVSLSPLIHASVFSYVQ